MAMEYGKVLREGRDSEKTKAHGVSTGSLPLTVSFSCLMFWSLGIKPLPLNSSQYSALLCELCTPKETHLVVSF